MDDDDYEDDSYAYWRAALADPKRLHSRDFTVASTPECGFYRTKDGAPVAIWKDEDDTIIAVGGEEIHHRRHEGIWLAVARRPIREDWYHIVRDGGAWPDLDEGLAQMGDNIRHGQDEVAQIDELHDQVRTYREIDDDETAARAQSLRARLLELRAIVDKKREELKAPHLRAARDVDEAWMPPVKKALGAANILKALIETWESKKRRLAREAEEARRAAEAKAFEATFGTVEKSVPSVPEPKSQIRSGYGRAASVTERREVVGITDLDLALQAYRWSDEVAEALIKLAQQAVDRGATELPGFLIEVKARLR